MGQAQDGFWRSWVLISLIRLPGCTEVAGVPAFNHKEDVVGLEADVWVDFHMPKVVVISLSLCTENGFCAC